MWKKILIALLTGNIGVFFGAKKNKNKDDLDESLEGPKAEEGGAIPVIFGTVDIKSPMVAWYGDVRKEAIKKDGNTVAYNYSLGMQLILCLGNADKLIRARVDEKEAYINDNEDVNPTEANPQSAVLDDENLFGGLSGEGGIKGILFFWQGFSDQIVSPYLEQYTSGSSPAYRGVTAATLFRMYNGTSSNLKKWDFRVQRIFKRYYALPQWYSSKAAIESAIPTQVINPIGEFKHLKALGANPYDWTIGDGAFGDLGETGYIPDYPINTEWDFSGRWWVKILIQGDSEHNFKFSGVAKSLCKIYAIKGDYYDEPNIPLFEAGWTELFSHDYDDEEIEDSFNPYTFMVGAQFLGKNVWTIYAQVDNEDLDASYFYIKADLIPLQTMNPAHIIRECLTDLDWGLGYPEGDIDDDSFKLAADTLYDESLGISLLWDRESSIDDFINEILRHASGELYVDRISGKFIIKLVRNDYDVESLLTFDQSNVNKITNYKKAAFGELVNSVVVNFQNLSSANQGSINIRDGALIQSQDGLIQKKVEYQGIINPKIATEVGRRDLNILSSPLLSCTLYTYKIGEVLNAGDVFILDWPDYEINSKVMRVNNLTLGNGKNKEIKIKCTEDVFATPIQSLTIENPIEWEEPSQAAINTYVRLVFETPYRILVNKFGQVTVDYKLTENENIGFLGATGGKPTSSSISFDLWARIDGGGFSFEKNVDFCPFASLDENITELQTTIPIKGATEVQFLETETLLKIDNEIMRLVSIDVLGTSIVVERGMLDTIVTTHTENEYIIFFDNYLEVASSEYNDPSTLGAKFLTIAGSTQLSLSSAFETEIEMDSRAIRPYPPGNFKINNEYFPDVIAGALYLTWAYRDRLSATLVSFTGGDVATEVGVTYNINIYDENDFLIKTETGITDNFYNFNEQSVIDDYFNDVQLLIDFEGSDGSTDFEDLIDNYILTPENNAEISTDESKIRAGSLYLDGASSLLTDDVVIPAVGDFTMDLYFYQVSGGSATQCFVGQYHPTILVDGRFLFGIRDNKIFLFIKNESGIDVNYEYTIASNLNEWHHVALVRDITTLRLYLNGVQITSISTTATIYQSIETSFGAYQYTTRAFFSGYLDYVRYTDVVRYADGETFDPPALVGTLRPALRIEIESERDGFTSLDKYDASVERAGYGYKYGQYYGGK